MSKNPSRSNYHIIGFESHWPKSLGEDISKFLNENTDLELIDIKYSSFGFLLSNKREENYSALVICRRIKNHLSE